MLTKIHHIGIVVRSLADAYRFWRDELGLHVHKEATVRDQGVKAALLPCGETEIELLEPIDPEGGVAKFLAKRGEGLHHLCFEAVDVAQALDGAKARGLPLLDQTPRQGLAGMIGFLHPKASCGVLVEYAQPPDPGACAATAFTFAHLAIVAEDAAGALATFERNFDLRAAPATAASAPRRLPISRAAIEFYGVTEAPAAFAGARGLAGIGLIAAPGSAVPARLAARAGSAPYGTTANGVPLNVAT